MNDKQINVLFSREFSQLETALSILPCSKFTVVGCPIIKITPVEKNIQLEQVFRGIISADYLIFTSQYAVIETIKYLNDLGISLEQLKTTQICAVGPMVARCLDEYGLQTNIIPDVYTAESLANLFDPVDKETVNVFFPKGNRAALKLEQGLLEKGYCVVSPIIYNTDLRSELEQAAQDIFDKGDVHCFAFTSPSAVTALMAILEATGKVKALKESVLCAIGTTTRQACLDAGLTISIMPKEYTIEGIAKAINRFYNTDNK